MKSKKLKGWHSLTLILVGALLLMLLMPFLANADPTTGSISGTVTNESGSVLPGMDVYVSDQNGYQIATGQTDVNGQYSISGIAQGSYRVEFYSYNYNSQNSSRYIDQYYPGQYQYSSATLVNVTSGQDTAGINAVMTEAGSINGRVTDTLGNPIQGVQISVSGLVYAGAETDANGEYTVTDLAPGAGYKLYFSTENSNQQFNTNYINTWYNNKKNSDSADEVTVTSGVTTGNIDVQLLSGGSIQGNVTDPTGNPVANLEVSIFDTNYYSVGYATTDSNGNYISRGIPQGQYKIEYQINWYNQQNGTNYAPEWYNKQLDFNSANLVAVATGQTTTVSTQVSTAGSMSGTVTDAAGNPLANVQIQASNGQLSFWAQTGTDGKYTVNGLPSGNYRVRFDPQTYNGQNGTGLVSEYYDHQYDYSSATLVAVTQGQDTENINAVLTNGGTISGTVTDTSGQPVANLWIAIQSQNAFYGATTNSDGKYEVRGLTPGTYKVQFRPSQNNATNGTSYVDQWYNGQGDYSTATPIVVNLGSNIQNIDAQLSIGGTITGTVTDSSGNPIPNVDIDVSSLTGNYYGNGRTDANGNYSITALGAASYRVHFNPANVNQSQGSSYMEQWYNNQTQSYNATPVPVTSGGVTSNINAQLQTGGVISGKVTDQNDNPLPYVHIWVTGTNNHSYNVSTDSNGNYTVGGVYPDNYRVQFDAGSYNMDHQTKLISEWYSGKDSYYSANLVAVAQGQTVSGINAALSTGGSISGTVTNPEGNPVANLTVTVWSPTNDWIASASTNADGSYTINGLRPGNFKVQFGNDWTGDVNNNYLVQWSNGKDSFQTADQVAVTAGSTTPNINAQLEPGGVFTGKVLDPNGQPVKGMNLSIIDNNGHYSNATSQPDGTFVFNKLHSGTYTVDAETRWYNQQNQTNLVVGTALSPITVVEGQTITSDIHLSNGGTIKGQVFDDKGSPVANTEVYLEGLNFYAWSVTDATGNYLITGLPTGDYRVNANAYGSTLISQWYLNSYSYVNSDVVHVNAGETNNINFNLVQGGVLTGKVVDPTGNPVPGVNVILVDPKTYQTPESGGDEYSAQTDSSGVYRIVGVRTGNYKLEFNVQWGTAQNAYASQWYNNQSYENSPLISVTQGQTLTDLNAQLASGQSISGTVKGPDGLPVAQISLILRDSNNLNVGYSNTDANGSYTFQGLNPGTYKVFVDSGYYNSRFGQSYASQWYVNGQDYASADGVTVSAGQDTTGVDIALAAGGTITGTVKDAVGNPISYLQVEVYGSDQLYPVSMTSTDANGNYQVKGLHSGTYKLRFAAEYHPGSLGSQWYGDKDTYASASPVTVGAGQTTSNVDAVLGGGASISGLVTGPNGLGIPDLGIEVYDLSNNLVARDYTDFYGKYTVKGLNSGTYKVKFATTLINQWNHTNYVEQWYNGSSDFSTAQLVAVGQGQNITDINAKIESTDHIAVAAVSPNDGASNVSVNKPITVKFNKLIAEGPNFGFVALTDANGSPVSISKTISGNLLTITPTNSLNSSATFSLSVPQGAIEDLDGNTLALGFTSAFTTAAPVKLDSVTTDLSSPQVKGTTIDFSANASGGSDKQYAFYINDGNGWKLAQDYSSKNTWSWIPDTAGDYRISVYVKEAGSPNEADDLKIITYTVLDQAVQPVKLDSVTTDKPSPQGKGTTIQVTANASGGVERLYQFWLNNGTGWTLAQDYSTSSTFNWTPATAGDYKISVYAKDKNSTVDADDVKIISYTVADQAVDPVKLNSVTTDKVSPQTTGSTITVTANATGGIEKYYQFWLNDGKGWSVVQDYSTSSTFNWVPSAAGDYKLAVYVKDKYSPNDPDDFKFIGYSITDQAVAPVTIQSVTSDQQSPQVKGTTIKFTANASGGVEKYYQYWLNDGNGWTLLRDYSTDNTFNWVPSTAGSYRISVYAKDKYSSNDADDVKIIGYTILDQAVAPVKLDGFTVDKASPQVKGTTVRFTGSASGGTEVNYQFWLNDGSGWKMVQDYSSTNTFDWTPSTAGDYKVAVYAKDKYSSNEVDDLKVISYSVLDQSVQPVTVDSVTTDKTSPQAANTTVTITANASGGTERLYQFWVNDGTGWKLGQDYSTANTYNWTPASVGNYRISVYVKDKYSTADADAIKIIDYTIN